MNFFNAKLERANGNLVVDTNAFQVKIPDDMKSTYENHVGDPVVFGIRPEDIHDPEYQPPGITPAEVESKITVVEPMGNELILYLDSGEHSFVGRVDPRSEASVQEKKNVVFNMENMHIFRADGDQEAIR